MALDRRPLKTKTMAKVPTDAPKIGDRVYDELLTAGSDGVPRLYKMHREVPRQIGDDSNKLKQFDAMLGRISGLKFDANGDRFAAASGLDGKGEVAVYDVATGKKSAKCESIAGPAFAVAWAPDGKTLASGGFDGKVWLHDTATGKLLKEFVVMPR